VAGDFNDWRSLLHPIFTEILAFRCATQNPERMERTARTYPSFSPRGSLDRIYYRGPIRMIGSRVCRLRVSKVASDHLPVVADFELR
jgi:endonuclease/exonuclease/phosphatase family metal-dependent hydrolase